MCQNVRHYACGHVQRRRAGCYKTGRGGGFLRALYDLFGSGADACDDLTGEVLPQRVPCRACARARKKPAADDGAAKPLPPLPPSARVYREACRAKQAMHQHDLSPRLRKRVKTTWPGGGGTEPPSDSSSSKPVLHWWGASLASSRRKDSCSSRSSGPSTDRAASRAPQEDTAGSRRGDRPRPPAAKLSKKATTAAAAVPERSSSGSSNKSALPGWWGLEYWTKARHRDSVDSDRSWVSPVARRIENGEISAWLPPRDRRPEPLYTRFEDQEVVPGWTPYQGRERIEWWL
ncbi:hypothetical protein CDD83_5956 [Cordyceps sp. RAO-2017]|nr:hypothetical protein CDD83_5956 [Cordyceps sp. RAO-2017]